MQLLEFNVRLATGCRCVLVLFLQLVFFVVWDCFMIIRPTDQPPEHLRKDVMGSIKLVMLLMRFVQLFMADYAMSIFENVRLAGRRDQPAALAGARQRRERLAELPRDG